MSLVVGQVVGGDLVIKESLVSFQLQKFCLSHNTFYITSSKVLHLKTNGMIRRLNVPITDGISPFLPLSKRVSSVL